LKANKLEIVDARGHFFSHVWSELIKNDWKSCEMEVTWDIDCLNLRRLEEWSQVDCERMSGRLRPRERETEEYPWSK
jgi:hypothetical protein